jgi:hypothetical protein
MHEQPCGRLLKPGQLHPTPSRPGTPSLPCTRPCRLVAELKGSWQPSGRHTAPKRAGSDASTTRLGLEGLAVATPPRQEGVWSTQMTTGHKHGPLSPPGQPPGHEVALLRLSQDGTGASARGGVILVVCATRRPRRRLPSSWRASPSSGAKLTTEGSDQTASVVFCCCGVQWCYLQLGAVVPMCTGAHAACPFDPQRCTQRSLSSSATRRTLRL